MSRAIAKAAVAVLKTDSVIVAWATGGILDRDPRRSGANATKTVFATTPDRDIKPVIACVGTTGVKAYSRIQNAVNDTVEVRIFAPDTVKSQDDIDAIADRIIRLLNGYRSSSPTGVFEYEHRQGIQNGGAFVDVAYDEIRFNVVRIYAPLEVTP